MKKLFLSLMLMMFLVSFVSAAECYQETANVSTVCGGLDTGAYEFIGSFTNPQLIYDGDWDTSGALPGGDGFMNINYSIPAGTINATWQTANTEPPPIGFPRENRTIPASCLDYDGITLQVRWRHEDRGNTHYECYNGTWHSFDSDAVLTAFEEAMIWDLSVCDPSPGVEICTSTCENLFNNLDSIPWSFNPSSNGFCEGQGTDDMDVYYMCDWNSWSGSCATGWPTPAPDPVGCPSFEANGNIAVDWTDCTCYNQDQGYGSCEDVNVNQSVYEAVFNFSDEFFSGGDFAISGCTTLSTPGTYYLQQGISTGSSCFTISSDDITIDMNGFNITGDDGILDYGITVTGYDNFNITNGEIYDFGYGIYVSNADNLQISSMIVNSHGDKAIYLDGVDGATLSDITVSDNGDDGIFCDDVDSSTITDITADGNSNGLTLQGGSISNTITDVTITSSIGHGVLVIGASNSNVFNNLNVSGGGDSGVIVNNGNSNSFYNLISYSNADQDYEWVSGSGNTLLYNNSLGEIKFLDDLDYNINGDMSAGNIQITQNSIYLNSVSIPALNKTANITFRNTGFEFVNLLKDGSLCLDCILLSSDNDTHIYSVTGFSNYTLIGPICSNVLITYTYENDETANSTTNVGFDGLRDNTVDMVGNFFSLAPTIGTISAVIVLVVIIFLLVSYVLKIKSNSDDFNG